MSDPAPGHVLALLFSRPWSSGVVRFVSALLPFSFSILISILWRHAREHWHLIHYQRSHVQLNFFRGTSQVLARAFSRPGRDDY